MQGKQLTCCTTVPPCRSTQETLDWISFVSSFLAAVEEVDKDELDAALLGKKTFTEALGFCLRFPPDVTERYEQTWCSDSPEFALSRWALKAFIQKQARVVFDHDPNFFSRLLEMKMRFEHELAANGAERENLRDKELLGLNMEDSIF